MKKINVTTIIVFALFAALLTGCLKNKIGTNEEINKDKIFKFETTKLCTVNLDFDLKNYSIIAELYSVNPLDINGEKIVGINPILRAITDKNGVVNDIVDIEKNIKTVYFYTEYLGLQNMIPIAVTDNGINFSIKSPSKSETRSATTRGSAPLGIMTLGNWDNSGIPAYLSPRIGLPEGLYYDIMSAIPPYIKGEVSKTLEYLGKGYNTELNVKTTTPINLVFVNETASMKNSICYYHYPTGQKPTSVDDVKLIIAFPNLSFPEYNINGVTTKGLSSGDNVKLKYWNSKTEVFEDEFPAGTTVALAIIPNSFRPTTGNIEKSQGVYYANADFNVSEDKTNSEHVILMRKTKSDSFVYLLEDRPRTNIIPNVYPGGDFHDAILYISSDVRGAIDAENIPELPETDLNGPEVSSTPYEGTLIFEDLWPDEGDYDMNDIVMEYVSTVYRNANNKVVKTVDEFTITNKGGQRNCGFGYQLNVLSNNISNVSVTPTSSDISTDPKGLEVGQKYNTPTIMLFGNIHNQAKNQKYSVTTTFSTPIDSKNVIPPYNPFITIIERGRELHLINNKPTSLANLDHFGKSYDVSNIEKGIYYVSKNNDYPFALKLPVRGFEIPMEGLRIDKTHPEFIEWVKSQGETNDDWYKSK